MCLRERFGDAAVDQGMPLFPTASGETVAKQASVATFEALATLCGEPLTTEDGTRRFGGHVARIPGARWLARLGIAAKEELGKLRREELAKHLLAAQPERARVVEVAAGTNRTFAKTADGWMYSWGGGDHGALGHGDELRQTLPKRLTCEEVVPDALGAEEDFVLASEDANDRALAVSNLWLARVVVEPEVTMSAEGAAAVARLLGGI